MATEQSHYKVHYFVNFMLKMITLSLEDIDIYRNKYQSVKDLSPSATAVLQCFKDNPEYKLTTKILIEMTNLPRRTITNSLKNLIDASLIQKYGQGAGVRYQLTF